MGFLRNLFYKLFATNHSIVTEISGKFYQKQVEEWKEIFGVKFDYKKFIQNIPPEHTNCRCLVKLRNELYEAN